MRNAATLVKPGGLFLVGALENCESYIVGGESMPGANISAFDMQRQLTLDFPSGLVNTKSISMPEHKELGYSGIILARAEKAHANY